MVYKGQTMQLKNLIVKCDFSVGQKLTDFYYLQEVKASIVSAIGCSFLLKGLNENVLI